jgi:hypothetical protein
VTEAAAVAALVIDAASLYLGLGLVLALAWVAYGIGRRPPGDSGVSLGARCLVLPAAAALWPIILSRWLRRAP